MNINGICVFCIKKMWQAIAIFLVITAVAISVLKYTLPHVDSYRDDIQNWVRDSYGAEIYIGNISAGWEGIGPAIILQNISFLPNETAPLDLVIAKIRVKIDFWASVIGAELTSDHFVLDGLTATVNAQSLLDSTGKSSGEVPIIDALSTFFLVHLQQFRVENSIIKLNTPNGEVQNIVIDELAWYNDELQHQSVGKFQLGGFATNSLSFVLDLVGGSRADLKGQLFIEARELDISPFLRQYASSADTIGQSNINFRAWTDIVNGVIEQSQISLGDNNIVWQRDKQDYQFSFGQGQLLWDPIPEGWAISTSDIRLGSGQQQWPQLNFALRQQMGELDLYVSQWSVEQALGLLSLVEISPGLRQTLSEYQPRGLVHDIFVQVDPQRQWQLTGLFAQAGWNNVADVPGGLDLSGRFGFNAQAGWVEVEGHNGRLLTGDLFKQDIEYHNLELKLSFWQDQQQHWQLLGEEVWLHNDDIDMVAEFSVAFDEQPDLALYAQLSGSDLGQADRYYPPHYMGQPAINYLNGAIQGGQLESAQVLWSGSFAHFPYAQNEGVLLVNAQVCDVDFLFAPGWPVLSNVDGLLLFRNDSLTIIPQKGYFLDIDLADNVTASIPQLSESLWLDLTVDTRIHPDKLAKMFKATPLRDIFSPVFEQLKLDKPVFAHSDIRIPLIDDVAEFSRILNYSGQVRLAGNTLHIKSPAIELTGVEGLLQFDPNRIWLDNLTGQWLGQPVTATVQADLQKYHVAIEAQTTLDTQPLLQQRDAPLSPYISGPVAANIDISLDFPDTGVNFSVDVDANLSLIQLDFPSPFSKAAQQPSVLKLHVQGDSDSALITANVDHKVYFNGILAHQPLQFSQAHLILGSQDTGLAGQGFKISVAVEQAQLMDWYDFIDDITSHHGEGEGPGILPIPALISGKIAQLNGFGHRLNGVDFELTEGNGSWDLSLNAKETRTVAHFDRDWTGKGVTVKTEYLRLTANDEAPLASRLTDSAAFIASIPPIDFSCMDCQYNQYNLSRIDIETNTRDNQLNISKFNITKGKHQFQSSGQWIGDRGAGISSISGRLTSDDIGLLLGEYDLTASVRDSSAKIDAIAYWTGGPHQFNLASLGGELTWHLGEGHLTEISDRGSRILSLLSFDSIVRKLKLDFRDVFSKGFFYNSMHGSMLIENGIAYTDNTEIDGVPGDLNLQGNVNLMTKKLDYDFVFYPKVTSSLPVIIGWMVNPITGIAALALDKMLESTKVVAQLHFTVTGTMDEPVVTEIERKSREIQIPRTVVRPAVMPQVGPDLPGKFAEQPQDDEPPQEQKQEQPPPQSIPVKEDDGPH